ncbi:MAG: hypothetical protein JWL88_309, partial [Parcubacteria group bacterium]|nr:hypothetical protein [Parcubacteria group bacterium]
HTSFANTTYGSGNYGSGNYGGIVVDITPPVISSIASSTSQTGATITWTTDENADSRIDLGTTISYGTASTSAALATSHSISFTSLTANTTYHFRIQSADALSNTATSSDLTFKTAAVPDTTPPVISAISSGTPGQTSATITWTTDEAASSTVTYGTTTGYGTASTTATLLTSHSITLTGLTANTAYHYQIGSADSSGNVATSSDQTFTTAAAPDTTPPGVTLTAPTNGATISGSAVSVTATSTDNIAVAGVTFYIDGISVGAEDTTFPYAITIDSTGLSNASHAFIAVARDTSSNYATSTTATVTVNNTAPDTTPPVIAAISAGTPGQTTATIHWTTDEAASSEVDYGTTTSYGTASTSATLVTSHFVTLTGLTANTTYHFRIVSADASSNTSTSTDQTFTTAAIPDTTPPVISSISSGTPGQTSATITWNTDETASSTVSYGATSSYGTASTSPALVTSHSITLAGLTAATTYHYQVSSADSSSNIATSTDRTFTTAAIPDTTPPIISSIASSTSQTAATITWTTDENSDSRIDLGTTASYGTASTSATLVTSHSITFTGLTANTTYHFRVQSADASSNIATSSDMTLKTAATPDTTPPVISAISSGTPGQISATITWTTDEAASSTVSYGTTTSYGTASTSPTLLTSHSITLSGLTAATTYHYQVGSADASANVATSSDQTFTTAAVPDTTPPAISSIASSTSQTSATITWTTDENSNSRIDIGTTASYGTASTSAALVTSHSITFTGLTANTTYHFRVQSADASSNVATSSDRTFTTAAIPDTTPPVISSIASSTSQTTATITWTTDEAASSTVNYGTTTAYGIASTSAVFSTSHSITLVGLTAATTYHYQVSSADASGNVATSTDRTFATAAIPDTTPPVISAISSGTPGQASATITWTTDEAASSSVNYGVTTGYGSASTSLALVISHTITLTGLTAATTYHYQIASADSSNNSATSTDRTFTTATDTTPPIIGSIDAGTPGQTTAIINWTTDEAGTSRLEYGTTTTYVTASTSAALVTSHSLSISDLITATIYHFRVISADASGNTSTSTDQTFTTSSPTTVVNSSGGGGGGGGRSGSSVPVTTTTSGATGSSVPANSSTSSSTVFPIGGSSATFTRNLDVKSTGGDVISLQQLLINAGFLAAGNATGYFGSLTKAALAEFQAAHGVSPALGYFGPVTRAALVTLSTSVTVTAPTTTTTMPASTSTETNSYYGRDLTIGARGEDVRTLQQWLNSHGYTIATTGTGSPGNETTYFGTATRAALARLQSINRITPATGYFGAITRSFINDRV